MAKPLGQKHERMAIELLNIHRSITGNQTEFLDLEYETDAQMYTDQTIEKLITSYKRRKKSTKNPVPISVEFVESSVFTISIKHALMCDVYSTKEGKRPDNRLTRTSSTGTKCIKFSDGSIMTIMRWLRPLGSSDHVVNLICATPAVFRNYIMLYKFAMKKAARPKIGVARAIFYNSQMFEYEPLSRHQTTPVIHPEVNAVLADISGYFDHIEEFTKYGMSGVRKTLLVGPPGTGKSSFAYKIAEKYKSTMSVVFANNISAVAIHTKLCCEANIPSIVIWEDAESSGLSHAGADILNFLDGIDQPQTKAGIYIIMTTNFPHAIDSRIKKRKGRVDRIFNFGVLHDRPALECALFYFKDILEYKPTDSSPEAIAYFNRLIKVVDGLGGAYIKELAYTAKLYASGQRTAVTMDIIEAVRQDSDEDMKKLNEYAEEEVEQISIGFNKAEVRSVWTLNGPIYEDGTATSCSDDLLDGTL